MLRLRSVVIILLVVCAAATATQRGARTMALDPATGRLYLATADFGPVPPATPDQPHPRPAPIPGSFTILVAGTP